MVRAVLDRAPGLDPASLDDVVLGCANGAGEDNRNVARMAVLLAGLPVSVPGVTVNRLCGSSLQAAMDASRLVEPGDARVVLAGGVESMTRAPWVLPKPSRAFPRATRRWCRPPWAGAWSTTGCPPEWTVSLGECNEQLAEALGIGRERQDAFAALSHQRAAQAWDDGFYDDAGPARRRARAATSASAPTPTSTTLAGLRPASGPTARSPPATPHRSTTGRPRCSSPPRTPAWASTRSPGWPAAGSPALEPQRFGLAPVEAAEQALAAAGIGWDGRRRRGAQRGVRRPVAGLPRPWPIDPGLVNTRVARSPSAIRRAPRAPACSAPSPTCFASAAERWGLAAICIGVGQGLAVVLENVSLPAARARPRR